MEATSQPLFNFILQVESGAEAGFGIGIKFGCKLKVDFNGFIYDPDIKKTVSNILFRSKTPEIGSIVMSVT